MNTERPINNIFRLGGTPPEFAMVHKINHKAIWEEVRAAKALRSASFVETREKIATGAK